MEETLVAQLLASAALAALVGDRITWNLREQGAALPALVLHVVSGRPEYLMRGRSGLTDYLVQMDCWGATPAQAKAVARALVTALDGLSAPFRAPGFVESERGDVFRSDAPGPGGAVDLHRTSLDVRAWFPDP